MKNVVTHLSVDLDAVTACWLIKKFLPGWKNAKIVFVHAGSTIDNLPPDTNPNIIHVDTGYGRFDHHQHDQYTCAAKLVFDFLVKKKYVNDKLVLPLERLVDFVNDIDHFAESGFPEATSDRYDFLFSHIVEGLKSTLRDDQKIIDISFDILDAVLQTMKNKVKAEEEIKKALVFKSRWGKTIAMETDNEEALKLALKMGYSLAIRKSPSKGFVRIKTLPQKNLDLTSLYLKLQTADKKASWFLHASKNMLLNGSSKNPDLIPSSLSLRKLIEIVKEM